MHLTFRIAGTLPGDEEQWHRFVGDAGKVWFHLCHSASMMKHGSGSETFTGHEIFHEVTMQSAKPRILFEIRFNGRLLAKITEADRELIADTLHSLAQTHYPGVVTDTIFL